MKPIKIIGRINKSKNIFFTEYAPALDKAIENFKKAQTVKVLKGICYIHSNSLGYFTEILDKDHISYTVITTLN